MHRQRHRRRPPPFEVTDDGDAGGVGRPHRERDAGSPAPGRRVSAEMFVDPGVGSFGEEVQIDVAEISHCHRW